MWFNRGAICFTEAVYTVDWYGCLVFDLEDLETTHTITLARNCIKRWMINFGFVALHAGESLLTAFKNRDSITHDLWKMMAWTAIQVKREMGHRLLDLQLLDFLLDFVQLVLHLVIIFHLERNRVLHILKSLYFCFKWISFGWPNP